MKHYIGLDAHSTTCTFVSLDHTGKEISKEQIMTSERNLRQYVRSLKGEKHLTFEESNLSRWLYVALHKEVKRLVVCNPVYLGRKVGAKNDYRDALHLANELRCNHLVEVHHDGSEFAELRSLVSGYNDLIQEIVRTKNRYKAIFRSQVIQTKGAKIYHDRDKIDQLVASSDRVVAKSLFQCLQSLEEAKKRYRVEFSQNMKKICLLRKLATIPGISDVRAHTIGALICDGRRFKNKHHLWSYAMLVRHHDQSDGVLYRKRKAFGRVELKNVFIGCAENILLQKENGLRNYYDHRRAAGLGHREAKKALARKVAAISLMIMKTGKVYDEEFEEKRQKVITLLN